MANRNGKHPESIAATVTDVSERMSKLVREEIELAKAEVTTKLSSIARGTAAVAAGAVFGVFAVVFLLSTIAWGLDAILVNGAGNIWIGFAIVFGVLSALAIGAFVFAWRKLRVGAPTPKMAIDEAQKIRETVAAGEAVPAAGETVAAAGEGGS
jgi:Putative Actinobacterial Holin-X, holin superfamily III